MKMKFDLERIIDDFIFFCFFIGNDFLPSLSALDIAEGSLDKLIDFY
jgi:5'-3' exonuclease